MAACSTQVHIVYTSRFVRVILAQGPLRIFSVSFAWWLRHKTMVFLCDEVSFQPYFNGENLTIRTVIWRTPEQRLLHIAPRFVRARAVTKLHMDGLSPPPPRPTPARVRPTSLHDARVVHDRRSRRKMLR